MAILHDTKNRERRALPITGSPAKGPTKPWNGPVEMERRTGPQPLGLGFRPK